MTTRFPKNQVWNQANRSNKLSDLLSSYNLDLMNNLGAVRVSPRFILNSSSADDANIGIPCAIKSFETTAGTPQKWWVIAGSHFFYSTGGLDGALTRFTTPSTPDGILDPDFSDMEVFNNELHIFNTSTTTNYIDSTGVGSGLATKLDSGAGLHACTYFRAQNKLYVVDNSAKGVTSMDTGHNFVKASSGSQYSVNNLCDANTTFITWIASNSNRIWIGTINLSGQAYVYAWDGSRTGGPNEAYKLESSGSFACVIKDDGPWIMDVEGRLLAFNGGTFVEVDRLPFDHSIGKYLPYVYKGTQRLVHYNGMCLDDNKIQILINSAPYDTGWPTSTGVERVPSGVWEYTKETGLYHRRSLTQNKSGDTITDYGQQKIKYAGCLAFLKFPSLFFVAGNVKGSMLAGAEYYTDASSSNKGIFYDDYANIYQKAGSFVTPKIFSLQVRDNWKEYILRFRKFLNATDKIVVKYRIQEDESTEATITYVNTTSFTVPASSFTTAPVIGDEVEILQGIGSGRTAHITAVSGTTTLTLTVDETIIGATTQTAKARFRTWKKVATFNSQADNVAVFPIGKAGAWIQFKVWILWTGKNELYDATIVSSTNQSLG